MRFILVILLVAVFGYSLTLVLFNQSVTQVDLLFAQVPTMNLGLLLVITLGLGIIVGLLLGVLVFRVVQTRWEIKRLNKELDVVRARHIQAAAAAAAATAAAASAAPAPVKHEETNIVPPMM
ncbi:LapA family protein [Aquirhabdus sp.]|uniref:LapA family protein n=1 Tax=Aquirhabdus sp. TaxID=2824160 RepID=UPI00396CB7A3